MRGSTASLLLGAGFSLALAAGSIWYLRREPDLIPLEAGASIPPASTAPGQTRPERSRRAVIPESATPAMHLPSGQVTLAEVASAALQLNAPEATAEDDLQILETLLAFYRRANAGTNPGGGLNEEFVEALRGKNSLHLAVLPADTPGLDAQGRLLDRWGTPYFFHPVSRTLLEVRSAGPDRKLWTVDDIDLEPENADGRSTVRR